MTRKLLSLFCFVTLAAHARTRQTPAPSKLADGNFGCSVPSRELRSWNPAFNVPRGVASKFKIWRSIKSQHDSIPSVCSRLTPPAVIIKSPGKGNLTSFDLVMAQRDIRVYRAYSAKPFACADGLPASRLGAFWSFEEPSAKRAFRTANAVCNIWNDFSMRVACTLKAGTVIAVGPTQSAKCEPTDGDTSCFEQRSRWRESYPASSHHQIFLNLRGRTEAEIGKFLANCRVTPWNDPE